MSIGIGSDPIHPDPTRRRGLRYQFTRAHHGFGAPDDSEWSTDLTQNEEFAIFDEADWHDLSDDRGHLYGLRRGPNGEVLELGTKGEQVAKFWNRPEGQPWHGFPLWPLADSGPANRRKGPSPRTALLKMEESGLLTHRDRKRLQSGKHVR